MKKWPVWMEGFAATGNAKSAEYGGEFEGETFADACENWLKASHGDEHLFDKAKLTYWGCQLFDNEADARKNFG